MKKIIPLFLALLLLSGCSAERLTPVINEDLKLSAIYKTGDFSFSCEIEKKGNEIKFTPTSTKAKGLIITCNGKELIFKRKNFSKSFKVDEIDKTNPALILYQVFSSLESAEVNLIDDKFCYKGNCSLGKYILKQNKDNSFHSLEIPMAEISIMFDC